MVPQRLYPGEDTLIGENEWENSIIDFITSDSRLFMASKVLKFKCPELISRDNPIKFDSGSISLRLEVRHVYLVSELRLIPSQWPGYIAWTCQVRLNFQKQILVSHVVSSDQDQEYLSRSVDTHYRGQTHAPCCEGITTFHQSKFWPCTSINNKLTRHSGRAGSTGGRCAFTLASWTSRL